MRIVVQNKEKSKQFGDLDVPSVFEYEGEYYLKISVACKGANPNNSIRLSDDSVDTYRNFSGIELVYPKKHFLTIED